MVKNVPGIERFGDDRDSFDLPRELEENPGLRPENLTVAQKLARPDARALLSRQERTQRNADLASRLRITEGAEVLVLAVEDDALKFREAERGSESMESRLGWYSEALEAATTAMELITFVREDIARKKGGAPQDVSYTDLLAALNELSRNTYDASSALSNVKMAVDRSRPLHHFLSWNPNSSGTEEGRRMPLYGGERSVWKDALGLAAIGALQEREMFPFKFDDLPPVFQRKLARFATRSAFDNMGHDITEANEGTQHIEHYWATLQDAIKMDGICRKERIDLERLKEAVLSLRSESIGEEDLGQLKRTIGESPIGSLHWNIINRTPREIEAEIDLVREYRAEAS